MYISECDVIFLVTFYITILSRVIQLFLVRLIFIQMVPLQFRTPWNERLIYNNFSYVHLHEIVSSFPSMYSLIGYELCVEDFILQLEYV